jgi:FkbM family methyltransferase
MKKYSAIRYYLLFIYYKIRIFFDCYEGRIALLYSEFLHLVDVLFHVWWEMPRFERVNSIRTIWGKFNFKGDLYSYLIMNPSFERPDMEYIVKQIKESVAKKERVLFLDIGANVGLYTVGLPTRIGKDVITIHAFEPEPEYFTLLKHNVDVNKIKQVHLHNIAIGDKEKIITANEFVWPGHAIPKKKVKYTVKRIDALFDKTYVDQFDRIYMKIDIEGHEEEALLGARELFKVDKPMVLIIEDAVKPSILSYLKKNDFRYRGKITPYNSFWDLH